jgi:glutathione peroxidase
MNSTIYNIKATTLQGEEISLDLYRGKTMLIVNTASKCGLTPQYEGLEKLYRKYREQGLVILGFPCNQFANQEPGDEKSISEGCLINYGVSFPMFSKIEVNGKGAHPLYRYLKKELPGSLGGKIKWNFTKFLVDSEGNPVMRFSPQTKPEKIDLYLEKHFASHVTKV